MNTATAITLVAVDCAYPELAAKALARSAAALPVARTLLLQYIVMTFLRGSLEFQPMVWIKMGTDTMLAMLAAPLIFLLLYSLASLSSYEIKYEGLRYRFDGR